MLGLLDTLESRASHPSNPDAQVLRLWGLTDTASKVHVDQSGVLSSTAVFAALRLVAGDLASVPLNLYRRLAPRGKELENGIPLFGLLHDSPNPELTAFEFRQMLQAHAMLWGNAYAEIVRDNANRVRRLWPLVPWRVRLERVNGQLVYMVDVGALDDRPFQASSTRALPTDRVLHIKGFSLTGLRGLDPVDLAREMFGLLIGSERFAAKFFAGGMTAGGVLEHPGELTAEAYERLRKQLADSEGLTNAQRTMILEEGTKFNATSIDPQAAQFLESRRFLVSEVARWSMVPPHKLYELDRATFSNIEHQGIDYVTTALRQWAVNWEQRLTLALVDERERGTLFFEHNLEGLLRGDLKTRYEAYAIGRNHGFLSPNDVRERESMNPIPGAGGDAYHVQLNMIELGSDPLEDRSLRAVLAAAVETRALPPVVESSRVIEPVEFRSPAVRRRLRSAFRPLIEDAGARLVRREAAEIRKAANRELERGESNFKDWIERFYRETFPELVLGMFAGIFGTYARNAAEAAAEEIGAGVDIVEVEDFVRKYLDGFTKRRRASSQGQLLKLLDDAANAAVNAFDALDERLDQWAERRPRKIGLRESVKLESAVAVLVFTSAGRAEYAWQAFGDNCPYCDELDGTVIPVGSAFLDADQPFEPERAERPLIPSTPIRHAPAHDGCDCSVVALG